MALPMNAKALQGHRKMESHQIEFTNGRNPDIIYCYIYALIQDFNNIGNVYSYQP